MYEPKATKLSMHRWSSLAARQTTADLFHHLRKQTFTTPETPKFDACVSVTLQISTTAFTVGLQIPTVSMRAHSRNWSYGS
ncbi:hypothetical protein CEXT_142051 [Caerostris extrusa]|uniref:Uncharacterized protein n=1 Tax=Caerostris extrusa TaxID=172846 RepID=A0AAV4XKU2_CAEEX|nr:hypothetical protein CEXT_142051 [Caerostris extrusa]